MIDVVDIEEEELKSRYAAAMHAVQSGVAAMMEIGDKAAEPKHLRVGINSAMVNDAGLVALLVKKGVITNREYLEAIVEAAETEKASFEARLSGHYKTTVVLG
jgi:hypothetical protein